MFNVNDCDHVTVSDESTRSHQHAQQFQPNEPQYHAQQPHLYQAFQHNDVSAHGEQYLHEIQRRHQVQFYSFIEISSTSPND